MDETYCGSKEEGVVGRLIEEKALIIVVPEEDGASIGRVRVRCIPDLTKSTLYGFIAQSVEPGSTVRSDGLNAYRGLWATGMIAMSSGRNPRASTCYLGDTV